MTGPGEPALADTAEWRAAAQAQLLPRDYARPAPGGGWTGVYSPVPIAHPPAWCDHLDTVCGQCLPAWAEDYHIGLFRHGPSGAGHGCRCPACRTTVPALAPRAERED